MSLRVIAGSCKGRRLRVPEVENLRPTTDRLKQVLFDLLGETVAGARVVDLFAGSGSLGIEALSRGCESATFIESNSTAAAAIRENLTTCGFEAKVVSRPVEEVLSTLPADSFDLALVDPPYKAGLGFLETALEALARCMAKGATVAVEAPPGLVLPGGYLERRRRRAGSTELVVATL